VPEGGEAISLCWDIIFIQVHTPPPPSLLPLTALQLIVQIMCLLHSDFWGYLYTFVPILIGK
jgi:hypothetical protein